MSRINFSWVFILGSYDANMTVNTCDNVCGKPKTTRGVVFDQ